MEMSTTMMEILAPYNWQLYVIIGLAALAGLMLGLLIGGKEKAKAEKAIRYPNPESDGLPTIGSARHGQKVTICGAKWTIM